METIDARRAPLAYTHLLAAVANAFHHFAASHQQFQVSKSISKGLMYGLSPFSAFENSSRQMINKKEAQ